jgi:thiamine biosynthesis lipoprotein
MDTPEPSGTARPVSAQAFLLDTLVSITIYGSGDQSIIQEAFDEIARLEAILSATIPGSDPDRLAQSADAGFIEVSQDTVYLLKECAEFSALSGGAFDCTVGPLVSLWNIREPSGYLPTRAELEQALSFVGYHHVLFLGENQVMLKNAGMAVDFGAIAKGYIADKIKELLIGKGIGSAVIDLGGDIALLGGRPDGAGFRIGVRDPGGSSGDYFSVLTITNRSLASSGSYERFFIHEGMAYHHIFDVATGYPAENELLQVTAIADNAVHAEGYSTTAFLMGLERGLAFINNADGIEAVFVTKEKKVYLTNGAGQEFLLTSDEYAFAD